MAKPPVQHTVRNRGKSLFLLRLSVWLAGYVLLVVTWGRYNAWPPALAVCLVFFPLHLVLAGWLCRQNRFPLEASPWVSEWDALIAFLILAIGVASGRVLVLAVGWVGVGAVYLRPPSSATVWDQWFKLPLLFLFSFPLGLDLAGSRHDWLHYFNVWTAGSRAIVPGGLPAFDFQIEVWLGLYALLLWLSGTVFWISLLLWPILLLVTNRALQHLLPVGLVTGFPPLIAASATVVNLLTVAALVGVGRRWSAARAGSAARWLAVSDWARIRSRAPWLVAVVIVLQQSPLVEGWRAGQVTRFDAIGGALLFALLVWFRRREPSGAVHLNTRLLLALSLFVLLAAEWTDWEPLRNLSLGLLVVGLCSWRRAWRAGLLLAALFTWTMTLPVGAALLLRLGLSEPEAIWGRSVGFCLGLLLTVAQGRRTPVSAWAESRDNWGWQPVKRFGFILLCLLLSFQFVSAFWRERWDESEPRIHLTPEAARAATTRAVTMSDIAGHAQRLRIRWQGQNLDLTMARPTDIPVRLTSPELSFQAAGWQVRRRRLIVQPRGQAVELQLTRDGQVGCALWWFEDGHRTFTDYLRARRILWSGWNLTHRDLRVFLLEAPTLADPERLAQFARSQSWFRDSVETAGFAQRLMVGRQPKAGGAQTRY